MYKGPLIGEEAKMKILDSAEDRRSELTDLLAAAEPFAKAFELIKRSNIDNNEALQRFLDSNTNTPSMTMGDFRKIYEVYVELSS